MTNSDFVSEVFGPLSEDQYLWVCNFRAPPDSGEWGGRAYRGTERQASLIDAATEDNCYFSTAVFSGFVDGSWVRSKGTFYRLGVLVVDDVDPSSIIGGYTYAAQTSAGKWQVGIALDAGDPDCRNLSLVDRVMSALSARGKLGGNDSSGNACVRYARLPFGRNTKPRAAGPWTVQLAEWCPQIRWSLEDACKAVGIELDDLRAAPAASSSASRSVDMSSAAADALGLLSAPLDQRSYHDSIIRSAASLISGGMFPGAAVDFLYGFMDRVRPSGPPEEVARWAARRAEIPRAVKSAEKFAPPERAPLSVNVRLGLPAPEKSGVDLLTLPQLESMSASVRWQVKAIVPADSLGMMFGASGTFKSFIALDHCLHIAHGLPWLGRKSAPGAVVYVAAEGGAGIYRRVAAWHKVRGLPLTPRLSVCIVPLVLSIPEQVAALASAIEALPDRPSLIYVDTLSQTFEGDENSATDVAAYLRALNAGIRARFLCTVIVIHHSGHAATERPRGSSAITANVDFLFGVYRPDAGLPLARLEIIKQKDGDKLAAQSFELTRVVLGSDDDGDEISSLAAKYQDIAGPVLASFAARLSGHEQVIFKLLEQAGGSMSEHDLRHRFYDAFGEESRSSGRTWSSDSARKAWGRTMDSLARKGLVVATSSGSLVLQKSG